MSVGAVSDRFRPTVFVPSPKQQRRTSRLLFLRYRAVWRSILETTPLPGNRAKKTAERTSVVTGQGLTIGPATVCVRRSSFDNRAAEEPFPRSLEVLLPASP